tara:strand:- start:133 stop:363 length:231 start_codon:yes stop_codon:yes gene_type:complete
MKDNMTLNEAIQLKIGDVVQYSQIHFASIPENKRVDTRIEVVTGEYQYNVERLGWSVRLETLGINCHNFRHFKKLS